MRWTVGAVAGVAVACAGGGAWQQVFAQLDGGADASVDAPDAGDAGIDAGPDAGPDGGPDAGPDGGTAWHPGDVVPVTNGSGWRFASAGLPSGSVMGASADENGNFWVAGGTAGVYVQAGGAGRSQQFTIADGLHPYGYLPGGAPADNSPTLSETPAIS